MFHTGTCRIRTDYNTRILNVFCYLKTVLVQVIEHCNVSQLCAEGVSLHLGKLGPKRKYATWDSWNMIHDYILMTNFMCWLLFIHKILPSSKYFEPQVLIFRRIQLYICSIWYCHSLWEFLVAEPQVLIFRRIQLYTCSIWYCHSLWEFLVACRYWQATRNSHREWQYHMLHLYNCILLKMSTWGSKHVEESSILWINNNQRIKLVINI